MFLILSEDIWKNQFIITYNSLKECDNVTYITFAEEFKQFLNDVINSNLTEEDINYINKDNRFDTNSTDSKYNIDGTFLLGYNF